MTYFSGGQAAQMFYARQRRRARAEATAGHGGGMRELRDSLGFHLTVKLSLS